MATTAKARKYKKVSCHKTKTTAKSEASKMRASGKTARVTKTAAGVYCIYSAGMRKAGKIKRTGQKIAGIRKRK